MAFTTRFYKKRDSPPDGAAPARRHTLRVSGLGTGLMPWICWALLLAAMLPGRAFAEEVQVKSVKLEAGDEGIQLNADFELLLSGTHLSAIRKGVPLYFVVEFELSRPRWYWLDDMVVRASRERRVAYAPLTEQFRVTTAGISQNFSNAEDVKRILSRVRSWTIAEKGKFKPGEKLDAAIRFRLDTSQLPKPFQLDTFGSREWNLSSNWHRWTVTVGRDGGISP